MRYALLIAAFGASLAFCTPGDSSTVKINGISLMGNPTPISDSDLQPLSDISCNYVALMPFAYGRFDSPKLTWKDVSWQWWGESKEGVAACIELAQSRGMKAMIKPQLWFDHGKYTGYFALEKEEDWATFEKEYEAYILLYAEMSETYNLDLFCIGTELIAFVEHRPRFWTDLIDKIERVYSGKLTYAGNWDSYSRIHFWGRMDYLGVDAYFPVSDEETPKLNTCLTGWKSHKASMKAFSEKHAIPLLFTEWGYRSTDFTARRPWDYNEDRPVNEKAQAVATDAVFQTFWDEPWFAGGFTWKWYGNHPQSGGPDNTRFTPQNKQAQAVIARHFKAHSPG